LKVRIDFLETPLAGFIGLAVSRKKEVESEVD
jgi:hypothetical protein